MQSLCNQFGSDLLILFQQHALHVSKESHHPYPEVVLPIAPYWLVQWYTISAMYYAVLFAARKIVPSPIHYL